MRTSVLLPCLLLLLRGGTHAQTATLDQAEAKIAAGAFADARQQLQRWQRDNPNAARAAPEQQARYHALTARIITRADSAQDHYLTIALNFPTAKVAPEALLRLAQLHTLRHDTAQAVQYLQRLLNDYPQSELSGIASSWLSGVRPRHAAQPSVANRRVAIQVGAFSDVSGARRVKAQLEAAGFRDVRLVRVPDNTLIRVRIGQYANRAAAAPALERLQQKQFTGVLVTDVANESSVQ